MPRAARSSAAFRARFVDAIRKGFAIQRALDRALAPDRNRAFKRAFRDALAEGLTGHAAIARGLAVSQASLYASKKSKEPPISGGPMTNEIEFREK